MLVTGEQDTGTPVCPGSHFHVDYSADKKLALAKNLRWRKLSIRRIGVCWIWLRTTCRSKMERGCWTYVSHVSDTWMSIVGRCRWHFLMVIPWGECQKKRNANWWTYIVMTRIGKRQMLKGQWAKGIIFEDGSKECPISEWNLGGRNIEIVLD